jgi:hypothetical protein
MQDRKASAAACQSRPKPVKYNSNRRDITASREMCWTSECGAVFNQRAAEVGTPVCESRSTALSVATLEVLIA